MTSRKRPAWCVSDSVIIETDLFPSPYPEIAAERVKAEDDEGFLQQSDIVLYRHLAGYEVSGQLAEYLPTCHYGIYNV